MERKNSTCFKVKKNATCPDIRSPCCDIPISKIEFKVKDNCNRSSVQQVYVNGDRHSHVYESDTNVLKITNLIRYNVTEVCITLVGECNTLTKLVGNPGIYAIIDKTYGDKCCVVGQA